MILLTLAEPRAGPPVCRLALLLPAPICALAIRTISVPLGIQAAASYQP